MVEQGMAWTMSIPYSMGHQIPHRALPSSQVISPISAHAFVRAEQVTASHHSLWQHRLGPVPTRIGHLGKPKDDGTLLPAPDWRRPSTTPPSPHPDPIHCSTEGGTWLLPSNKSTSPTALSPVSLLHEDTQLCPMPTRTQTSAGGTGHLTGDSSTVTSCCHQSQAADSIPCSGTGQAP